jgi:isoleucyl-tRNA synthetase
MSIGPTVIAQVAESLRKLRNSARFCLANLGPPETLEKMERVPRAEMGYVRLFLCPERDSLISYFLSLVKAEKYVMHELYNLEKTALDEYTNYNFPKGIFDFVYH